MVLPDPNNVPNTLCLHEIFGLEGGDIEAEISRLIDSGVRGPVRRVKGELVMAWSKQIFTRESIM